MLRFSVLLLLLIWPAAVWAEPYYNISRDPYGNTSYGVSSGYPHHLHNRRNTRYNSPGASEQRLKQVEERLIRERVAKLKNENPPATTIGDLETLLDSRMNDLMMYLDKKENGESEAGAVDDTPADATQGPGFGKVGGLGSVGGIGPVGNK